MGKSIAAGMAAAALALTTPNIKVAIFSTSQRIAGYLGEICHSAVYHVKPEVIAKYGEEWYHCYLILTFKSLTLDFGNNDIRRIYYYPANPKIDFLAHSTHLFFTNFTRI